MNITKMNSDDLNRLKEIYVVLPILNKEKTRIIDFVSKRFRKKEVEKQLNIFEKNIDLYYLDHWFSSYSDIRTYVYRKKQHVNKFNDDLEVYLSLRFNLKQEVVAANFKKLKELI